MKTFQIIYNSLIWGLIVAILAFQSVWLEMRMNIGIFVPIVAIIAIIVLAMMKKGQLLTFKFSLVNLLVGLIVSVFTLGFRRIMVVPASIVREGLGITQVSFSNMNIILMIILIGGLILIYFNNKKTN
jgi:hypothetical protein